MTAHARFQLKDLPDLAEACRRAGVTLPVTEDLSILGSKLVVAGRTLANRFGVQPMEGFDAEPDGGPGPLTFRRYLRYAAGGFALIWAEATAVIEEGKSNPRQLCLHGGNVGGFRALVEAVREEAAKAFGLRPVLVLQLTHSGRYSKPGGKPAPIIAHHSPVLDPQHRLPADYPVATDAYLDRLQEAYVAAAKRAEEAGFDGVDVKSCHRYLVSELLASHTREGRYGGSLENRTRFLRETLAKIRAAAGGLFITTRLNVFDAMAYPYGFGVSRENPPEPDLSEPLSLAADLETIGIPLLNVSMGNPYFNPHIGRPFDRPVAGMADAPEPPLAGVARFVDVTRRMQEARPGLPVMGAAYTWLRHLMPHVAAAAIANGGAAICGIGRGAFAYPDAPRDILERGRMDPAKCCVTCSACTQIMRDGGMTGCVVRDAGIYGPQLARGRKKDG